MTNNDKNDNLYENIPPSGKCVETGKGIKISKFGIGWMGNLLCNKNANKLESKTESPNTISEKNTNKNYNRPLPQIPKENSVIHNDSIDFEIEEEIGEEADDIYEHMNPPGNIIFIYVAIFTYFEIQLDQNLTSVYQNLQ